MNLLARLRAQLDLLLCLGVAVAVFLGWSAAPALAPGRPDALLGRDLPVDGAHTVFLYQAVARGLAEGRLGTLDAFWYPVGRPLLAAAWNVLDALLAAPLLLLLGPYRGTLLATGLFGAANALAGGLLGARLGGRGLPVVVGAVGLGFCPFAWEEAMMGRPTQALLAPLALALGAAGEGRAVRAGLFTALTGYVYWFHGLFVAPLVGALLLAAPRPRARNLLVAALACLLAIAPMVAWVGSQWGALQGTGGFRSFRVPLAMPWQPGFVDGPVAELYLPLGGVLLGLFALTGARRGAAALLAALVLVLHLLAFGETAPFFGAERTMPWAWLQELPVLSRLWWPYRALGAASVGLVALMVLGAHSRLGRFMALPALVIVVAQVLHLPGPLPLTRVPGVPGWHTRLPAGPVLVLPAMDGQAGKVALLQQAAHGRPLVNGMGMRDSDLWPPAFRDWWRADPLLSGLEAIERGRSPAGTMAHPDAGARLRAAGVVAVVAERNWLLSLAPPARSWLEAALGPPACDTHEACVFRLAEDEERAP